MERSRTAPPLTLTELDGRRLTADRSRWPALLAFFHTGCATSRLAAPFLERFHRAYSQHGVWILAISQDPLEPTADFTTEAGWTLPVVLDPDGVASQDYTVDWVPTLYWINRAGRVTTPLVGFDATEYNELSRRIASAAGVEPVEIVSPEDGVPDFRPG